MENKVKQKKEIKGRTERLGFAQHTARAETILLYTRKITETKKCQKCVVQETCYPHGRY